MGTPGSEVRERWGRGSGVEEAVKSPDRDPLSTGSAQLSGRWGPVFTVRLGRRPAVVLCGYSALRDALVLQADAFSGRGATAVFERFTRGNGESPAAAEVLVWTTQFERFKGWTRAMGRCLIRIKANEGKQQEGGAELKGTK